MLLRRITSVEWHHTIDKSPVMSFNLARTLRYYCIRVPFITLSSCFINSDVPRKNQIAAMTYDICPRLRSPAQHTSQVSLCPGGRCPAGWAAGCVNAQESSEEPSLDRWRGWEHKVPNRRDLWNTSGHLSHSSTDTVAPLWNPTPSMHAAEWATQLWAFKTVCPLFYWRGTTIWERCVRCEL